MSDLSLTFGGDSFHARFVHDGKSQRIVSFFGSIALDSLFLLLLPEIRLQLAVVDEAHLVRRRPGGERASILDLARREENMKTKAPSDLL